MQDGIKLFACSVYALGLRYYYKILKVFPSYILGFIKLIDNQQCIVPMCWFSRHIHKHTRQLNFVYKKKR